MLQGTRKTGQSGIVHQWMFGSAARLPGIEKFSTGCWQAGVGKLPLVF